MGRISAMRIKFAIAGAVVVAMATCCWLLPPCKERARDAMGFDAETAAEFSRITNSITHDFRRENTIKSYVIPCAYETMNNVKGMTNATLRLAVARYLARELLALNITNNNYRIRWQNLGAAVDSIPYVFEALWRSETPEMEQIAFFFDALQRFKEGAIATLDERRICPTEMDKYGRGEQWAQDCCKAVAQNQLENMPCYFTNGELPFLYSRLSPEAQEYFKKRFRDVFGIDYVPDEKDKHPRLWGLKGTRWSGKDLEWR